MIAVTRQACCSPNSGLKFCFEMTEEVTEKDEKISENAPEVPAEKTDKKADQNLQQLKQEKRKKRLEKKKAKAKAAADDKRKRLLLLGAAFLLLLIFGVVFFVKQSGETDGKRPLVQPHSLTFFQLLRRKIIKIKMNQNLSHSNLLKDIVIAEA